MASKVDEIKEKIKKLPTNKEIDVIYKTDSLKQIMNLLDKELKLLK